MFSANITTIRESENSDNSSKNANSVAKAMSKHVAYSVPSTSNLSLPPSMTHPQVLSTVGEDDVIMPTNLTVQDISIDLSVKTTPSPSPSPDPPSIEIIEIVEKTPTTTPQG